MNRKYMKFTQLTRVTQILLLVAGCSIFSVASALDYIDAERTVQWQKLDYHASKFFLTAESTVTVDKKPARDILEDLVPSDKYEVLKPKGESVFIVTTDTDNFGTRTRYTMWFDSDATILQRLKVRTGDDNDIKLYRHTPDGYLDFRKGFNGKKFSVDLKKIAGYHHSFKPYSDKKKLNENVTESTAFLYLVGMLDFKNKGDMAQFTVSSRGKLANVKLLVKGRQKLYADYKVVTGNSNHHVKGDRDVLRIAVLPVNAAGKPVKNMKLMGVQGRLYLYLDVENRLLLQITGEAKVLGDIDIKLGKAVKTQ
ncbi:MAG: hypothetical protein PVH98_11180 [Gammaproteobacteria bacterium]|jgi:hypothetical protein